MKGINQPQHQHLLKALQQLERLLSEDPCGQESLLQALAYRYKLETMHSNYKKLLKELSKQITAYEVLYNDVKVQFLGKKLKELKKEITYEKPDFLLLLENIRLAYGT
jgi:hypothetical protein